MKSLRYVAAAAAILAPAFAITAPAAADDDSKLKRIQSEGYIGQLSRRAIAKGAIQRLKNKGFSNRPLSTRNRVFFWHEVALDSVAIDHTPDELTGEAALNNGGPTRTSRALAMTQIAVFDALNAFNRRFEAYEFDGTARRGRTSDDAAVAAAAYGVLKELYPEQEDRLRDIFDADLDRIRGSRRAILRGVTLGFNSAGAILDNRDGDGSEIGDPSFGEGGAVADGGTTFFGTPVNGGTTLTGEWTPDPNTPEFAGEFNLSLGAFWGAVTPFSMDSGDQFRIDPFPALDSAEYEFAYNETAAVGGAPTNTGTASTGTNDTRFIGNYWGYDGVPLIGVPPRLYAQIAAQNIDDEGVRSPVRVARLLALVNVAQADAAIGAWDSKYFYNYWRPVVGIRSDDTNANTPQDMDWDPVGTSVINTDNAIRPTPPFPAYPSGHAAFGAATFEVLRDEFGDSTPFTFISDEYNGEGTDPFDEDNIPDAAGTPRPLVPVRYSNFTEAQVENGRSRVFNGVHWNFDDIEGQGQGVEIARNLLDNNDAFQRRRRRR